MNKPIRNLAVACMLLFVALLLNATYLQYWQADDLTSLSQHPDNKRVRDAEFSRERGAILVRGKAVAESNKSDDALQVPAGLPAGPAVRPPHRLLLPRLRASAASRRARTPSSPAATPGCSSTPGHRPARQRRPQGRQRHADRQPRGAEGGVRRAPRRSATTSRAPSSRSSRAPARSWRWSPARPTTPTCWPATTSPAAGTRQAAPRERQARARCTTAPSRRRCRPGSTFKLVTAAAALDSGKYTPDTQGPRRRPPRPAADHRPT